MRVGTITIKDGELQERSNILRVEAMMRNAERLRSWMRLAP
jgi:hypothetical protein